MTLDIHAIVTLDGQGPIYTGNRVTRYVSGGRMTVCELTSALAAAQAQRDALIECVANMQRLLDEAVSERGAS